MINEYVTSILKSIENENWYAGLTLALTIPDICGSINTPNENSSKKRFIEWYDAFVLPRFSQVFSNGEGDLLLNGADCYALRCSFLHNGIENISNQRAKELLEKFYFIQPLKSWSFNTRSRNNMLIIQIDRFCKLICDAVDDWLKTRQDSDFSDKQLLKIYNPKTDGMPL